MAKTFKRPRPSDGDDDRIGVKVAATFRYDGVYVRPGDLVRMTRHDYDQYRTLSWVYPIEAP